MSPPLRAGATGGDGISGAARSWRQPREVRPPGGRDGLGWLLAATVVFTVAELAVVRLRLPLGWDEITYIAQTSAHQSPLVMPPIHSRGRG